MTNVSKEMNWVDFILVGAIMALIGVLLIIFKSEALSIILIVFGVLLVLSGALNAFGGVRSGDSAYIALGAIRIVIGVLMIILTALMKDILMVILAVGLIIFGAINLLNGIKAGLEVKERILPIIVGVALVVAGIFALMNLNSTANIVMIVIGVIVLISGVLNIIDGARLKMA